jgi:phenylacetic acid degradation protein
MGCYEIDGVVPVVAPTAFVHPDAVLIGDVIVGDGAYVGPLASLRGDFGRITVGAGANVQDGCVLHCFPGAACTVEPEGHIGHGAVLHGCTVRSGAMVGMNAVVMDGAVIGARALVGASAFVAAGFEVPAEALAAGNPAKIVRQLDEQMLAWKANGIRVYQELARRSLASLRPAAPLAAIDPGRAELPVGRDRSVPLHEYRQPGRRDG